MESGLDAINTENVILSSVSIWEIFYIQGEDFNLTKFKKIKVVGFGKSSCEAALSFGKNFRSQNYDGAVIGLEKVACKYIETFAGTHPRPSEANVKLEKKYMK